MRKSRLFILIITSLVVFSLNTKIQAGSIWLAIDTPEPAPHSGDVFETALKFTTWDAVNGSYLIRLLYDPAILQVLQVTTPSQSEFAGNTFVDLNSFTSGATSITAFQVINSSEQSSPATFATIQWKAIGNAGTSATIGLETKTMIDSFWRPIDVNSSSLTLCLSCPDPGIPSNPSPSDMAIGVPINPTLNWTSSNADSYDIYLGTSSNLPYVATTTSASYPLSGLSTNTAYSWKVVAKNNNGNSTSGPVWQFTTGLVSDATGPSLSITSHIDGQHVSTSSITLAGTASDSGRGDNGIQQVTVSGARASNDTATGSGTANWSRVVSLGSGANAITVFAYDDSSNHNTTTQTLTIYYDLTSTYTLTVNVNPATAGGITKNPDKTIYNSGEMVQLTANANSGYAFSSWSGNVFGNTNPISFIMDSNKSVTAHFSTISVESVIFVSLDGTCNGDTPCFSSIQNAIDSAGTFTTIVITEETYLEGVILNSPKVLTLQGGWDSTFTNCLSSTTINGSLTISDGTLVVEKITLQ